MAPAATTHRSIGRSALPREQPFGEFDHKQWNRKVFDARKAFQTTKSEEYARQARIKEAARKKAARKKTACKKR